MDLLPEISQSPRILSDVEAALKTKQFKAEIDDYIKVCFLFLFYLSRCLYRWLPYQNSPCNGLKEAIRWDTENTTQSCCCHSSRVLVHLDFFNWTWLSLLRECSCWIYLTWVYVLDQNRNVSGLISMDLKGRLSCSPQETLTSGSSYNVPLLNALVLYVGMQVSQQFWIFFSSVIALGFSILVLLSMAFTVVAMIITIAKIWHKMGAFVHFIPHFSTLMVCFDGFPPRLTSLSALK